MLKNSIIVIAALILFVCPAQAWDIENGTEAGEDYELIWHEDYNYYEHAYAENPAWYDSLAVRFFEIRAYLLNALDLQVIYNITKSEWNGTGYEQTEHYDRDQATFFWDFTFTPEQDTSCTSRINYIERYFNDVPARVENWDGDSDHPDVLYVAITIDGPGLTFDRTAGQYITLSDDTAGLLGRGNIDFGYGTGRGSGAGSGSIYEGLGLSGIGEGTGDMSELFGMLFWLLIPLVFMLCVFQIVLKAL